MPTLTFVGASNHRRVVTALPTILTGADELSRTIAAYAAAKADTKAIEAKIFAHKSKILLESSLETFEEVVRK